MDAGRLVDAARLVPGFPLLLISSLLLPEICEAKVFLSQQEALEVAFPDCDEVRERTYILSAAQAAEIERIARSPLESRIFTLSSGWKQGKLVGHAFIEVHTVRTKAEAFIVVIDPGGTVGMVKMLAFHEPLDYLPTDRWFDQFDGKTLEDGMRVGRDVHGVVGATLSTRAISQGVRRALAIHRVLVRDAGVAPPEEGDSES